MKPVPSQSKQDLYLNIAGQNESDKLTSKIDQDLVQKVLEETRRVIIPI
jgi:hypothetical protein